jgi:Flp pilus assembly CpaF family ATPase
MLISMHPDSPKQIEPLIGEAVHCVIHIARTPEGRRVAEIVEILGFDVNGQLN